MNTSAISKNFALNGAHTAGIFADMTVDGPEIGTLVCVVDRAKNLPNRKTIGKQDPYCAARLGKEAKKTSTDIRGGQTPRWDQELRFTVHDTADYYQLKVSVFTDDKKTDLIGETWVDLKSIIISGGGQCDFWKTLTCRGKYAGDIRLEITYYDTRPKPDKSPAKPKPPSPDHQEMSPVKRKEVIKRRPLSSMDPAAVEATSTISAAIPTNDVSRLQGRPSLPSDYSTPPSLRGGRQSLGTVGGPRELRQTKRDAYENPRHSEERDLNSHRILASAPQPDYLDSRAEHAAYASDREEPRQHYGERHSPPPPPPAHRARGDHDVPRRSSLEGAPQQAMHPAAARHELLKNEAQRKPSPSYPGRPKFKGTMPSAHPSTPLQKAITYNPHMGGDVYGAYDPARSMQPTVEDYPESEAGSYGPNYRHNGPRALPDEMAYARGGYDRYDRGPVGVPAQMQMSRSPGASGGYLSQSPGRVSGDFREPQHRYTHSVPQAVHRDYDDETAAQMPFHGHAGHGRRHSPPYDRRATFHPNSSSHSLQELPPSLVPGADPNLAQEVAHRMYDDRRHGERYYGGQFTAVSTMRDGQRGDPPDYDMHADELRGVPSQAGAAPRYERRSDMDHYNGSDYQAPRRRDVSPNPSRSPNHAIRRKSVSPGPRISESRRLSDIPYGPDSYDTYNPGASRDGTPGLEYEPPSKIVMHDGTEVDPSDHLPMESWAPEPEQRPTQAPVPVENRSRPALTGAQPMPPSGRRQLRVRAQSNATASHSSEDLRLIPGGGGAPPPSARGRLQKKANRGSIPAHPLSGLDAYASLSSDDLHDRQGQYSHSRSPRAGAWDYSSDGYTPKNRQGGAHGGPPIPAKVPLPITGGGNGGAEVALMEEMQKIDIGTGRSRRRGGY